MFFFLILKRSFFDLDDDGRIVIVIKKIVCHVYVYVCVRARAHV